MQAVPCQPLVLLVGDTSHAEFRPAAHSLSSQAIVHHAPTPAAAQGLLSDGLRPDVIILAQQRPGDFAPAAVEQLRRHAPLAPVIALQSSWCEGEGRSGRPLPGVVRVSWRRFEADIVPGLIQLRAGQLPDWAGPATLTPEERLLAQSNEALPNGRGTVGIVSHSYETRRLLTDTCRAGGWNPIVVPTASLPQPSISCDALLWDVDELPTNAEEVLTILRQQCGDAPVIVLLGFAREHDLERARAAGAAVVIGKPFSVSELLHEIEHAASRHSNVRGRE